MESQYHPDQTLQADLRQYIALLLQWAWLIVLATLLAGAAAFITSKLQDPVYQASTKLLINEAPSTTTSEYTAILTSERLARTYSELMTEDPILEAVIEQLNLNLEQDKTDGNILEALAAATEVQLIRDTQLIELSVEDTDPEMAARIANTIVEEFIEQNQALQSSRFAESKTNLEEEMARIQGQIHNTLLTIDELGDTPEDKQQRDRLEADVAQYRQTHAGLLQSYEQIRVAEAQTTSNVIQVKPAAAPEKPIRPRVLMNTALAAVVGGMLAVGAIFLMEALDDTIKSPEDVNRHLGLPILGTIMRHEQNDSPITTESPRSPTAEAFRSLRTNIQYASVDYPLRSVLVTSPDAGVGKSTVAINLGTVLAQGGTQVVLVDGDMRRPKLHELFKLKNRVGLSSLIVSHTPFVIEGRLPDGTLLSTSTEGLSVITSGQRPPNPSELLASKKMMDILQALRTNDERVVIIDAPPVMAVTDAAVLSPRVDGVLLVVKPGVTKLEAARQTVEQLRRVGANIVGVVLNSVDPRSSRYGYYYRYDHEYYHVEDQPKRIGKRFWQWGIAGGVAALLTVVIAGWYFLWPGIAGQPISSWFSEEEAFTPTPTEATFGARRTEVAVVPEEPLASPTATQTPKPDGGGVVAETEPTNIPAVTPTPTNAVPPTPGPSLLTPFGPDQAYLLHQVKFGDNLPNLAEQYQTDRDVIVAANGLVPDVPLQPDQVIVIMPGRTDSIGIDPLVVNFLSENTSIFEFAPRHGVTTAEIRRYNQLGPGEIIPAGRWLIFPKREVTPTVTPTAIPTPDLSHALTEPFGPNAEYVLHEVSPSESTYSIEGYYLTSAAVIKALNDIEGAIQPGQILVILLERRDPSGITPFSVFYVEDELQVEAVAEYLGILNSDLRFYNDLEAGEIIAAGRYVIYPTP